MNFHLSLFIVTYAQLFKHHNFQQAEYERDELLNTNIRLSKRCAEKDEMEKKSITTILHLKQLTEKLEQEKTILEKKIKGSEQFGLAARLTLKAKQKVEEEVNLEKKVSFVY